MKSPVVRQRARLSLGRLTLLASLVTAVLLLGPSSAGAAISTSGGSGTSPVLPTSGDNALDAVMLAAPLPGLVDFTLVGPGATNGVLTAQTMASYSDDPDQVEQLFDQYSSESGFAGWIKTWQDRTGMDRVVEIAIRFHDSAEASTNAAAFVTTLSKGQPSGTRTEPPSIPGASAFSIDQPATTSGNVSIPAQQVQAVVYADADYLVVIHTDSSIAAGSHPIADGTGMALALQQYQDLIASVAPPNHANAAPTKAKTSTNGDSATRTVGIVLLGAVALVVAAFAILTWRRRRTTPASSAATRSASATSHTDLVSGVPSPRERRPGHATADRHGARRIPTRSVTGQHSQKQDPRRTTARRRGRTPASTSRQDADGDRLVGVAARASRPTRSQRLESSRTKHPSAAVVLAHARPKETAAGWYEDPSDGDGRRIRYWDGTSWTAHVAEPEG